MGKTLLIVESPGKIKSVQSYVGNDYIVAASVGHIMDLDGKSMSVDIENKFKPKYIHSPNKGQVISNLRRLAKQTSDVIIATDMDREGEMIGWCIAQVLGLKKPKRLVFHSITKTELLKALKKPEELNYNLINAQKARRILDRIVGYELSPLVCRKFNQKLSAGRVQSVVVELIVDKEKEVDDFYKSESSSFFKFSGNLRRNKKNSVSMRMTLNDITKENKDSYQGKTSKIYKKKDANKFLKKCMKSKFSVKFVNKRESKRKPSPPFTTSTLQQDANRKLSFATKRTMSAAQRLYENGYITYMRTDSVNLSDDALKKIKKFVIDKYGKEYHTQVKYKAKTKNAQEAHEAVRPTKPDITNVKKGGKIGNDEVRLYNLIWKRAIASQMSPAVFDVSTIQVDISKVEKKYFEKSIEKLTFSGFLKVYNISKDEDTDSETSENGEETKKIKIPKIGNKMTAVEITGKQEFDRPVPRYNEGSLVKKLEVNGIGRPATVGNVIETIQKRGYIEKKDFPGENKQSIVMTWNNDKDKKETKKEIIVTEKTIVIGKEKNKMSPTSLGKMTTTFLVDKFSEIMKYEFTSSMEKNLDSISNGKKTWFKVLDKFYKEFHPLIVKNGGGASGSEINKYTKILGKDPKSGEDVIAKSGKYGPYIVLGDDKKRTAKILDPHTLESITLKQALKLLKYPKLLGEYKGKEVYLKKGTNYYINYDGKNMTVENNKIKIKDVAKIITEYESKLKEKKKDVIKIFDTTNKLYTVRKGPYGNYVNVRGKNDKKDWGKNYGIKNIDEKDIEKMTLKQVKELIDNNYNSKSK